MGRFEIVLGRLKIVVDRCGSLWDRCGSLWIVVDRCGSFRVLVTTLPARAFWHLLDFQGTERKDAPQRSPASSSLTHKRWMK